MKVDLVNRITGVKYKYYDIQSGKYMYKPEISVIYIMYPDGKGGYLYRWFKMLQISIDPKDFDKFINGSKIWRVVKGSLRKEIYRKKNPKSLSPS